MAIQSQPSRIPEPFAGSGTKNTIPATNATPSASQAASWASGFPPECSQPISAGGCPVPRNDVNGALNQLSQDFAFRQDGGIWEWSALADYDSQRVVRGSDGLLYFSLQQSGPGFASGAKDPTADDGTYWSSPHVPAPSVDDVSAASVSTQWFKNWFDAKLAATDYYVDPANGDDANAGTSQAAAKKTLSNLMDGLRYNAPLLPAAINIHLTVGTYNESLTNKLSGTVVNFVSQGTAANNTCTFATADFFTIGNTVSSLSGYFKFTGVVAVARSSVLNIYSSFLNFHSVSGAYILSAYNNGLIIVGNSSSVTMSFTGTCTASTATVLINSLSTLACNGNVTVIGAVSGGKRYSCTNCSGITGAGSSTLFPNASAGTTDSTSFYS